MQGTKALSWNVTGPRGPAGTTGLIGTKTNQGAVGASGATCTLGEVLLTAGNTVNGTTLLANGQTLPISSNTALLSLLGTEYGGNGTTTFALPNLQKSAPDGLSYSICVSGVFPEAGQGLGRGPRWPGPTAGAWLDGYRGLWSAVLRSSDGRAGSRCESGAVPPLSPGSDSRASHDRAAVGRLGEAPIREPGDCSRRSFACGARLPRGRFR